MPIQLRNPHSVEAILKTRPKDVVHLNLSSKASATAWEKVEKLGKELRIPISFGAVSEKDARSPRPSSLKQTKDDSRQGGSHATVKERASVSLEELFRNARDRNQGKGLWLALDQLQDPHNLGAIFRSAAFFGVQGIILTQERSAPLSSTVYDVASGGVEYVPFVMQPNLKQALEFAKEAGAWILGTSEHAHDPMRSVALDRPWLLVLGNEESGLRRLTEESCDVLCSIPSSGKIGSLNVAVSAGIMISYLSGS